MNKKLKAVLALTMCAAMSTSMVGCSLFKKKKTEEPAKTYTYSTYTAVSPSNWNELTYQDNNDTQIMSYLGSNLFEFDFAFDDKGEIIPGDFEVEYSFATSLTDLSEGAGTKWQITIRNDGKWNDGTPIVAGDFVYTMQEQLNPLFKNYRADSFYNGSTVIKNAEAYVKQGSVEARGAHTKYTDWAAAKAEGVKFDILGNNTYFGNWAKKNYSSYYEKAGKDTGWSWLLYGLGYTASAEAALALQGKTFAEIEADATLKATWDAIIGGWKTEPNEELHFFTYDYTWPAVTWDQVGFSAPNDTTIVLELEQGLQLLNEDGTLSYKAAYNMASLPLVKKDLYEACKVAPVEGSDLWTSKYHSSLETTASWGPYMLTEFQAGKMYKMEKNPNWYGWNMDKYQGKYQTTHIVCETIAEYNTAFLKFKKGEINGIGIDVSIATDYKNSDQAYYTPSDYVGSLQLQSSRTGMEKRQKEGINKTILLQEDFRKALSLGLDRDAYAKTTTTAHLAGFGLFNSMHYYDVANGKAYRESDAAKKVLCDIYNVNPADYGNDLDKAVDAITGYDLTAAKALVNSAYDKAVEAGDLKTTDKVVLTYGTSVDNEATRRHYEALKAQWTELMKGTKLEGKFDIDFDSSFGSKWADDFRAGAYDICEGGWTGAAWDPGYFLLAYLGDDYRYASEWDPSVEMLEFTMKGVKADGTVTNKATDTYTATKSLAAWYDILNGDWASGVLNEEFRLDLIAAIEKAILTEYYTVPATYEFSASLISFKADYITYEYNTFMSYGGIRYMTYNYDDAAWAEFVAKNAVNGELNYK